MAANCVVPSVLKYSKLRFSSLIHDSYLKYLFGNAWIVLVISGGIAVGEVMLARLLLYLSSQYKK